MRRTSGLTRRLSRVGKGARPHVTPREDYLRAPCPRGWRREFVPRGHGAHTHSVHAAPPRPARLCPPLYGDCQEGTPVGQQAPRAARADRGGGSRAHERHALSSDSFFVRPGAVSSSRPASFSEAPRAAAVKAGRRWVVTTSCVVARPRLDGSEHGARVARSGAKGRAVSSPTSLVLDWAVINMRKAPHNLVSGRA